MEIQYYSHLCACGCGGKIEIKKKHKYNGIPQYIHNHHMKGKKLTEERKQKIRLGNLGKKRSKITKQNISKSKKGIKHTEEFKQKISLWNKENYTEERKIKVSLGNKGKKRTQEHKEKYSKSKLGNKNPSYGKVGGLAFNWQGGKSFELYLPEFNKELRNFIKNRDFHICQTPNCINTENLHIHHMDYNKKNNNPENLITLCHSCHSKTNGKNNRLYWFKYYFEIINIYL